MRAVAFFLFLLIFQPASAQFFGGRVVDKAGLPVPDATIYINELKSGITADNRGEFQTQLASGTYNCEVSSLGYKREKFSFEMKNEDVRKTITLKEIVYELKEVHFTGRGEDRGNAIMRKAISRAPFFRYQVKEYEAESYLKGTMKITRIPAVAKLQFKKNEISMILNKLFLVESISTIAFKAPNNYVQTIKAFSSTIPDEINPGDYSLLMKSSIYEPEFFGMVSPLSPDALIYYRFVYQGITNESGKVVNKILVVPQKGNSKLMAGHIYIVDETWNVSYVEMVTARSGIKANIKINFNEVKENVFLPTGYNIGVNLDILGVNGEGRYYSSIKYRNIYENNAVQAKMLESKPLKDKLSNREASKIAKANQRIVDPPKEEKQSLEIKVIPSTTKVIVDSSAKRMDSAYWLSVRKLPLREDEVKAYKSVDSLKIEYKQIKLEDSIRDQNGGRGGKPIDQILFGHKYNIGKKWRFSFGGVAGIVGDFNFVDGYQFGQNISLEYFPGKGQSLKISPSAYYSTERKTLLWQTDISYKYAKLKDGKLNLSVGNITSDISSNPGTSRFINSYTSFLFGCNPVKFMSKKYIELSNSIDIANGFRGDFAVSYQERGVLNNSSIKSLFGKTPDSNIPDNIYFPLQTNSTALVFSAGLTYTPKNFYRINNGKKEYVRSSYPTFSAMFRIAPGGESLSSSSFSSVEMEAKQSIKINIYSKVNYSLSAGTFISKERVFFPDFKHFRANNIMVSEVDFDNGFLLLDNYLLSTPNSWVQGSVNYSSEYILLKYLPFFNTPLVTEALHFRTLWLTNLGYHHTEIGYSIGMPGMARIGVFAGLKGFKYQSVGFRLSIPVFNRQSPVSISL